MLGDLIIGLLRTMIVLAPLAAAIAIGLSAYAAYKNKEVADRSAKTAEDTLRHNNRLASLNFVVQALNQFAADAHMQDVFYDIEHREFEYPGGNKGSPEERRTDRLLRHFAAVALARENGLVKSEDLVLIRYYVVKTMRDPNVMRYVNKVCGSLAKGDIEHPYAVLKRFHKYLEKSPDFSDTAGTKR